MRPPLSIFACVACILVVIIAAAAAATVAVVCCSLHALNLLLSRNFFVFLLCYMFAGSPYINRLFARSFVRSVIVQTVVVMVVVYLVGKQKSEKICKM